MATSIEQIAVWLLESLRDERRRERDWEKSHTEAVLFTPVRDKHRLVDADLHEAVMFLHKRDFAKFVDRKDGRVAFITQAGLEYLDAWLVAHKPKTDWTRVGVWIALATLAATVFMALAAYFLTRR